MQEWSSRTFFHSNNYSRYSVPCYIFSRKPFFYSSPISNLIKPLCSVLPFHLTTESSHKHSFPSSYSTKNRKANHRSSEQRHSHTVEQLCLGAVLQKNTCPRLFKDSTSAAVQCTGRHEQPFFYLVYARTMIYCSLLLSI